MTRGPTTTMSAQPEQAEATRPLDPRLTCCIEQHGRSSRSFHLPDIQLESGCVCRLHAQANSIHDDTLGLKRQEAGKRDAIRFSEQRRIALQDGLIGGLWVTLAMSLFCGVKCGYLGHQLGRSGVYHTFYYLGCKARSASQ